MLVTVNACAVSGLVAKIVDVEVDFNPRGGLPSFIIVGPPDTAVNESRERVRAAIKNPTRTTANRTSKRNSRGEDGLASTFPDQKHREKN